MKCAEVKTRLSALLDGALTPAEEAEAREHLAACEACRAELDSIREVVAALRAAPPAPAPAGFADAVLAALPARRRGAFRVLVPAAALAAAALLAAVLVRSGRIEPGTVATEVAAGGERAVERDELKDDAATVVPVPGAASAPKDEWRTPSGPPPADGPAMGAAAGLPAAEKERTRDKAGPRFLVKGSEPDASAGLILAELEHRRHRTGGAAETLRPDAEEACLERVVADEHGEPASLVLCLTSDEETWLLAMLRSRQVSVVRRDGDLLDRETAAETAGGAGGGPASGGEAKSGAPESRRQVEFHFDRGR